MILRLSFPDRLSKLFRLNAYIDCLLVTLKIEERIGILKGVFVAGGALELGVGY
jgi:hypothetical protein